MEITATDRAVGVIEQVKGFRDGQLTITIGTGCCESTAPFLYENFWPGPDQAEVGVVAGVTVYAPEYVRDLYPGGDGMVIDVIDEPAESLSVETELGCRLILRGQGVDLGRDDTCAAPAAASSSSDTPLAETAPADTAHTGTRFDGTVAELPEHLQGLRIR